MTERNNAGLRYNATAARNTLFDLLPEVRIGHLPLVSLLSSFEKGVCRGRRTVGAGLALSALRSGTIDCVWFGTSSVS